MFEINPQTMPLLFAVINGFLLIIQLFILGMAFSGLRTSSRERLEHSKELFGLVRKLEGLTASKREQMLKHYDTILERLSSQIPPLVAAQTSNVIFETESKVLSRLAEIEPDLKNDERGKLKMEDLIRSMESLEKTIVTLTSDAVERVMVESRRDLLDDGKGLLVENSNLI